MLLTNRTNRTWKPTLEALEDRLVPASGVFSIGNPAVGYYLKIQGSELRDEVSVFNLPGGGVRIRYTPGDTMKTLNYDLSITPAWIRFEGYGGNNSFLNFTNIPSIILCAAGDDFIQGGSDRDLIMAGNGHNEIHGGGGDDILIGGMQRDVITGDAGNDFILGLAGSNILDGGEGNDYLEGGDQADWLIGGVGNDILIGQEGDDWLFGNDGNNHLFGGTGDDRLFGGSGSDLLFGGLGYDRLYGGEGNDFLSGGYDLALDWLDGGNGNDTAERYVQVNQQSPDASAWNQMVSSVLYVYSAGLTGMPPFVDGSSVVSLQDDDSVNCERLFDVYPSYGKDPEFVQLLKDQRSAVGVSQDWSNYVLYLSTGNLQGSGTPISGRSSTRTSGSRWDFSAQQQTQASNDDRISITTQQMNFDLPPVELIGVSTRFDWLGMNYMQVPALNTDALLLQVFNQGDLDETCQTELFMIQDLGGLNNWSNDTEAVDSSFIIWDNDATLLNDQQIADSLLQLETLRQSRLIDWTSQSDWQTQQLLVG